MNYISELSKLNKNVPPKCMGMMHRKNAEEISLKNQSLTENYIPPFVSSLVLSDRLKSLCLTNTGITKRTSEAIFINLPDNLERLNLTNNPLICTDEDR